MRTGKWAKSMGRISRIGSFAIASSLKDNNQPQPCITCTTFNILAPIYKRIDDEDPSCRESDYRAYWLARNHRILDWLLNERSSIICLQVCVSFLLLWDWVFVILHKLYFLLCRSFGLEMKNLLICMRRDLVMLVMLVSSLEGLTTVEMVYTFSFNFAKMPLLIVTISSFYSHKYLLFSIGHWGFIM